MATNRTDVLLALAILVVGGFTVYVAWNNVTVDIEIAPYVDVLRERKVLLPLALGFAAGALYAVISYLTKASAPQTQHNANAPVIVVPMQSGGLSFAEILVFAGIGLAALWWYTMYYAPAQQNIADTEPRLIPITSNAMYEQAWANLESRSPETVQWRPLIEKYAAAEGVDPLLAGVLIWYESGGDPAIVNRKRTKRCPEGSKATGLMQIMSYESGYCYFNDDGDPYFTGRPTIVELQDAETNVALGMEILATYIENNGLYQGLANYGNSTAYADTILKLYNQVMPSAESQEQPTTSTQSQRDTDSDTSFAGGRFPVWPSASKRVCGHFGNAVSWQPNGHTGVDICAGYGTPIRAVAPGVVRHVGELYGRKTVVASRGSACAYEAYRGPHSVHIDHGGGIETTYSHMIEAHVSAGQRVQAGDVIGKEGNRGCVVTGRKASSLAALGTSGSHLHFEVLKNGSFVDPMKYLPN